MKPSRFVETGTGLIVQHAADVEKVGVSGQVGGVTASKSPTSSNIQGALHVGGYLSDEEERKRKKKKKVKKADDTDWQEQLMQKSMQDTFLNKAGARHNKKDQQMLQEMHDHSVALGAHCLGTADDQTSKSLDARIFKVDESLGLVMGWAIVCKRNGEDYYDLNIDPDGSKVPEHIPEDSMMKAAMDFMLNSRMGNEMHAGEATGTYAFAWPMTSEIAKAMGIQTNTTGLMVAYKPPPELLSKFVDGTYKGFSIEGRRVSVMEMEDA